MGAATTDDNVELAGSNSRHLMPDYDAIAVSDALGDPADGLSKGDRLVDYRMIISDDVMLESQVDTHVVVGNSTYGTRLRLSRSAYRFLQAFREPRRIDEILSFDDALRAMPQVRILLKSHLLENADAPVPTCQTKILAAVAYKFCNAPALVATQSPDFVVLGLPYDLSADTDGRLAPELIRRKSLDYPYQLRLEDAVPRGWFDVDRASWILAGATIADAGDVHIDHGETKGQFRKRVALALEQSCRDRSIPLILGGDRSVTYAAIAGIPRRCDLVAIQLTANPTNATAQGAGERLREIGNVVDVVTLGSGVDRPTIANAVSKGRAVYLSIDLDLVAPARKSDVTESSALQDLKTLIAAIGAAHEIVGIDLVGLNMRCGTPVLGAITGCQLALTAMSAAHHRGAA